VTRRLEATVAWGGNVMSTALPTPLGRGPVARGRRSNDHSFAMPERLEYLRSFGGHSMSTSLLAPEMRYFDLPGVGFIGFMTWRGSTVALADPVAAIAEQPTLVEAFLASHPRAAFVQTSEALAQLLHRRFRFYATQVGVETLLDLDAWSLRGRKKQALRTALNQASARGIIVSEGCTTAERETLSSEWLATRRVSDTEIAFLVRPLGMEPTPGARVFCARAGSKPVGFVCFDPLFAEGEIVGYVPNVSRASAEFRQGIFYAITLHAMQCFAREGARVVNLGLSPLAVDTLERGGESVAFKHLLGALYRFANRLYNFQGIRFAKSRFRGREEPVFLAHRAHFPVRDALAVFKLSGVF